MYSLKHTRLSFLKYTAQQIKFDLEKNHPLVLSKFYVEAKDRKFQFWERNALAIDIMSHHVFIQKLNYIHLNPVRVNFCEHELNYEFLSVKHYHEIEHPYNFLENYDRGFWQCFILVGDNTNKGEKARQDAQIKKPQCITLWL